MTMTTTPITIHAHLEFEFIFIFSLYFFCLVKPKVHFQFFIEKKNNENFSDLRMNDRKIKESWHKFCISENRTTKLWETTSVTEKECEENISVFPILSDASGHRTTVSILFRFIFYLFPIFTELRIEIDRNFDNFWQWTHPMNHTDQPRPSD